MTPAGYRYPSSGVVVSSALTRTIHPASAMLWWRFRRPRLHDQEKRLKLTSFFCRPPEAQSCAWYRCVDFHFDPFFSTDRASCATWSRHYRLEKLDSSSLAKKKRASGYQFGNFNNCRHKGVVQRKKKENRVTKQVVKLLTTTPD
uniref:Uncharacterized protein n=1 Tax=Timema douglasi TaxID=61478 RepID=A0A7R8V9M2_TIMDO|nr:unnamed protein product [Timema douglasi]